MKVSNHLLHLNLAVFLISTSGIFGRLVSLSPELTILYRCILAAFLLFGYIRWKKIKIGFNRLSDVKFILAGGVLMAAHWVSYFYSLKLSSIAIAMLTLHTFPVMTSILEPFILKTRFHLYHILLAIIVLLGVWIILPSFDFSDSIVIATMLGLVSALAYALRNIWTRRIMPHYNASLIMFYHLVIMALLLSPFSIIMDSSYLYTDWSYILALAIFTTVLGHTLLVNALRHFSAISVGLLSSIIPVYGIIWGIVILGEYPDGKTIAGGALIMTSFIIESVVASRKTLKNEA